MYEDGVSEEVCANCVYWENRGGAWGRCWAPESNGEALGIQIIGDGAILVTAEDFSCSAWAPSDGEDEAWDLSD